MEKDFKGTIAKYLNDFFETFTGGKESAKKIVTDFTGAKGGSLHDWTVKGLKPIGIRSIKLRCFLSLVGYSVTEFPKLSGPALDLSKIVVYDIDSIEGLADKIGLNPKTLAGYFRGDANPSSDIVRSMETVYARFEVQVREHEDEWKRTLNIPVLTEGSNVHHLNAPKDAILSSLAGQISAILPLATIVASDDFSLDDRNNLRKMVPNKGVFEVSNLLNALCSETARKLSRKGGK